jgi:type II secretory pathway pseudopilin PulG
MRKRRIPSRQRGFTYIGLLILLVLLGIGLALTGQVWHTAMTREKERELLFIGGQFRKAIESFHTRNHGVDDGYPKNFDELLRDPHQPGIQRYLRTMYIDPFTGNREWGLIKSRKGGIAGVYSLAQGAPLKQVGFPKQYENFVGAATYADWTFVAQVDDEVKVAAAPAVAGPTGSPAAPVPAPAPVPAIPGFYTEMPEREPGKDPTCDWVAANDTRLCNQEKIKWHDAATACFASGNRRAALCATGVRPADLPALAIRFGSPR